MWWLAVPILLGVGKIIHVATSKTPSSPQKPESILVKNLHALRKCTAETNPRRIALLGQPGAGKSTILKKLSKGFAKPAPVIGTNTDATNWAESTDVDLLSKWGRHIVVDVPGYDTLHHPTSAFLDTFPFANFEKIFLILRGKVRAADIQIYNEIIAAKTSVLVVRSYAESLNLAERQLVQDDLCKHFSGLTNTSLIFVSSRTEEGIKTLRNMI
ncbi:GTP-binding protein EngB required for normal cell division [Janthinobacterium sp. 35]|uniref:GTPase domain-containing protein n=1 Tax=Janthinobacterium sp. 35 TaxID=2035210 RepID=UPI000C182703|nr:GTPase domain-containing protein [Janthinobacterium sp. 35]PIG29349.1 GTP-binding protein EngB required for normal cell division [Janthinobacterium sp. 35]